ncbi:hypothetical protein [Dyella sp. 20L07]|uniref:hypothetical protein n=1 Tax=Dyella sp. 20L07 TaxID=3384240 RepID=UPI003D29C82A
MSRMQRAPRVASWRRAEGAVALPPGGGTGLASENDFLDMYRTLGLRPGCALPELKQAFRRHVGRMHPDRKGEAPVDPVAAMQLQRLIAQYDAAMSFQREHGRLPGSTTRVRFAVPETVATISHGPVRSTQRPAWRHPVLTLLLPAVVLAVLGWDIASRQTTVAPPTPSPSSDSAEVQPLGTSSAVATISLGMSRDDVRQILGDPVSVQGDQWEYGPSWVRFEDDRVTDWYSSPLRSLGTAARTPNTPPAMPSGASN